MQQPSVPIASEGLPFILFPGFVALILALLGCTNSALFFLLLCGFSLYFFRDPTRVVPDTPGAVICPADGKVIRVEELDDGLFLHQRAKKISIFMNVFNVHVNRIPFAGTVDGVYHVPGRFYAADKAEAVLYNERCAVLVNMPDNQRYAVVQIAGLIARRIVCRAEKGDKVLAGERFGLIRFGSRVDLYLPLSAQVQVSVGQVVRCGESILAQFDSPDQQATT